MQWDHSEGNYYLSYQLPLSIKSYSIFQKMSEHYIFSYFNPFLDTLTSQTASEKYFSKIYEKQIKEQLVPRL